MGPMARSGFAWATAIPVTTGVTAVGFGIGSIAVAQDSGRVATYAGQSTLAAVLGPAAGLALVVAGLVLAFSRSPRLVGDLAVLAGLTWLAQAWIGWQGGSPAVRSLAMLAHGF